jgi:hypothetical protein
MMKSLAELQDEAVLAEFLEDTVALTRQIVNAPAENKQPANDKSENHLANDFDLEAWFDNAKW